jgi:hypothetical protein
VRRVCALLVVSSFTLVCGCATTPDKYSLGAGGVHATAHGQGGNEIVVLNATHVSGAGDLALSLLDVRGRSVDDAGAPVVHSVVCFADGQITIARQIAARLHVNAVRPLNAANRALAGPDAGVVVVLGRDHIPTYAQQP